MKNIRIFLSENFQILVVKYSIYLNRRVFVMMNETCYFVYKAYVVLLFFCFCFLYIHIRPRLWDTDQLF